MSNGIFFNLFFINLIRDCHYLLDKAIDLVGDLATYSITVRELNCFFAALQRTEEMKWVCCIWFLS